MRDSFYKLKLKYPNNPIFAEKFIFHKNLLRNEIRRQKCDFYSNRINSNINNPKALWETINEVIYNKTPLKSVIPPIKFNNAKVSEPKHKANIFNEYFINVSSRNSSPPISNSLIANRNYNHQPIIYFEPTTNEEVAETILSLDSNTAAGYDGVKSRFLKKNVTFFANLLCNHINDSFAQGSFPDALKIARVVPIHKDGPKDDPNNYRPISIVHSNNSTP